MFEYQKWLRIFDYKNIDNFLKSEKGKGEIVPAVIVVLVTGLLAAIPSLIGSILYLTILAPSLQAASPGVDPLQYFPSFIGGSPLLTTLVMALAGLIFAPVFFLLGNFVTHQAAIMLGGKGEYKHLVYLNSHIVAATNIFMFVYNTLSIILSIVPCLGLLSCPLLITAIAVFIYMLYVYLKSIMINYGLAQNQALMALGAYLVYCIVLVAIIFVIEYFLYLKPIFDKLSALESAGLF